MGVYLTDVHLINVHLTGVHLTGVHENIDCNCHLRSVGILPI
jgi:hypothetical protein